MAEAGGERICMEEEKGKGDRAESDWGRASPGGRACLRRSRDFRCIVMGNCVTIRLWFWSPIFGDD